MSSYFLQRVRAVPYFLQIAGIIYVCFVYFAAIAQVWINLHRQNVFYTVMLWKGSQVPQEEDEEEAVTKKAIKQSETFISQIFYNFFLFISLFLLLYFITFFLYFFYLRHLPRPTPTTHDFYPRPTTFSYTWTPAQSDGHPVNTGIFYGPLTFCINGVWLYLWWKGVLHVGSKQQQQLYLFFSSRFSGHLPCLMYIFSLL